MRCRSILAISLVLSLYGQGLAEAKTVAKPVPAPTAKVAADVKAKDLGAHTKKGIKYLVSQQQEDGGWGEGEEAPGMGGAGKQAKVSNVADTSIAVLALIRSGSTPSSGEHAKSVRKGLDFIAASIEKSDDKSLYVTDVRGTRVQSKIGAYVDTFLSSLVLAEAKGRMPDAESEKRIGNALNKVIGKIETNQKADGTFEGNAGWASVLSTGIAGKSLNRARAAGAKVSDESLRIAEAQAVASYDKGTGGFKSAGALGSASAPSDAGVPIYNTSAQISSLQDADTTNLAKEKEYKEVVADAKAPKAAKDQAKKELDRIATTRQVKNDAVKSVVKSLGDDRFIAGFGSNGGEEFLSYMNISETLVAEGGSEWKKWDREIGDNLARVQNADGSWSGHHCITGRTFVTATALLVLTTDRIGLNAPVKGGGASLETGKEPVKEKVASKSWYEQIWND